MNAFQVAGLATHALVVLIGLGAILGLVPSARCPRDGFGLVLMATAKTIVVLEPRLRLGAVGVCTYVVGLLVVCGLLGPG